MYLQFPNKKMNDWFMAKSDSHCHDLTLLCCELFIQN